MKKRWKLWGLYFCNNAFVFYFEFFLCSELCYLRLCFDKNLDFMQLSRESTERMRMNFVKLAHSQSGTPCALCGF